VGGGGGEGLALICKVVGISVFRQLFFWRAENRGRGRQGLVESLGVRTEQG
jgi:hypothetical protein